MSVRWKEEIETKTAYAGSPLGSSLPLTTAISSDPSTNVLFNSVGSKRFVRHVSSPPSSVQPDQRYLCHMIHGGHEDHLHGEDGHVKRRHAHREHLSRPIRSQDGRNHPVQPSLQLIISSGGRQTDEGNAAVARRSEWQTKNGHGEPQFRVHEMM